MSNFGPRIASMTCRGCPAFFEERWREPSGDGETMDQGSCNRCNLMDGKIIDGDYGSHNPKPPKWCPYPIQKGT